ncbi:MAG: hypothetical protein D6681_11240, partial [Calditrichaeota bacterium]
PQLERALAWILNDRDLRLADEEEAVQCLFAWRDTGRLLLLLDGLDELSPEERASVTDQVRNFVNHDRNRKLNNRVVLTSRLTGYSPVGGPFQEYTLKPFQKGEESRPFLRNWLHISRPDWNEPTLEQKTDDLWQQLQQQEALRRILTTPLILRMAAENYARTQTVARHRSELYRQYWETLWERAEERDAPPELKETCFAALEALAFHLHTGGKNDAQTVETVLREGAKKLLSDRQPVSENDLPPLLPIVNRQMGLLVRVGEGYRFSHQTFQEYGAAGYLAQAWRKNRVGCWRFLQPRLHLPEWREPILLLGGSLAPEETDELVRRVLQAGSPGEAVLLRDLRLAAALIGKGIPVSEEIRNAVLQRARFYLFPPGIHRLRKFSLFPARWQITVELQVRAVEVLRSLG